MAAIECADSGVEEVYAAWNEAKIKEKWMVAIWSVDEKGIMQRRFVTWNFPTAEFHMVTDSLQKFVKDQRTSVPQPEMLPPADPRQVFAGLDIDPNGEDDA